VPDEKLLTVSQAARKLGVSANTLRRWTSRGLVPHLRTSGGQRRFSQEQIEAIIEQMRQKPEKRQED
jgi:excisionase family DNA binding protein